ncbi:MAG: hypothetical protein ACSW8E_01605 [Clostridia bacterium]
MNNKKKKSDFSWGILIVLIPLLMRFLDGDMPPVAFGIVAVGVIFAFALSQVAKKKEKAAKQALETRLKAGPSAAGRKTPEVELHRPVPSMQRREPEARRDYSKPDAYCVSCDLSGEDHFVRDRNRRIAQLDEWLKNGLIDKQEYQVLKWRFENDQ